MIEFVFVEEKPMEGREVQPTPGAVIGREGTDIVLAADPEVSRRHAAIREHDGGLAIEDLGSTNGTFVNDERIEGVRALSNGDVVRLGNTVWKVRGPAQPDAGATTVGQVPIGAPQVTAARAVPTDLPPAAAAAVPPAAPGPAPPTPAPPAPSAPAPRAPQAPAEPAAPSRAAVGPRGDVPAPPEVAPSAIRRVLPPPTPGNVPAFTPPSQRKGGSAATRVEATVVCLIFAVAVAVALAIYFASQ
ncbi:MAG: hypothetical protein QOF37_2453 [Thermoleophilaceae bacterium]|nr:hypothetical protein [Thermoleophilaceae bacterium]